MTDEALPHLPPLTARLWFSLSWAPAWKHPLTDFLPSSWTGKLAASLCSFIMSFPPSCLLHAAGHCISLRTFSKSPRPGLLPPRDLGFLPAQHMLHTYRLSVLLPCHFCTPWMVPECLCHKEPVVSRTIDECELRERLKEYWHRSQKNSSMWHLFGHWDGRILKRRLHSRQVCWNSNITSLLTNCWQHLETKRIPSSHFIFLHCTS